MWYKKWVKRFLVEIALTVFITVPALMVIDIVIINDRPHLTPIEVLILCLSCGFVGATMDAYFHKSEILLDRLTEKMQKEYVDQQIEHAKEETNKPTT